LVLAALVVVCGDGGYGTGGTRSGAIGMANACKHMSA